MSSSRQRWSGQRQLLQHTVHHRGLALGDWHSKKFELGAVLVSSPTNTLGALLGQTHTNYLPNQPFLLHHCHTGAAQSRPGPKVLQSTGSWSSYFWGKNNESYCISKICELMSIASRLPIMVREQIRADLGRCHEHTRAVGQAFLQ